MTAVGVLAGLFLIAHGLVHALYFVTANDPGYPMTADKSWLVTRADVPLGPVRRLVSILAIASLVGFCLAALSHWGLVVPSEWFATLALVSSAISLLLIAVTWNIQFVFAVAINLGIIYWALSSG